MLRNKRNTVESGVTLIEVMIGAALLALVIFIGGSFMKRLQKSALHDASRQSSQKVLQALFQVVKRDAGVQVNSGLTILSDGLQIRRLSKSADDESSAYTASFRSSCQAFPAANQALMGQVYAAANRAKIYATPYLCLKGLNCPAGKYPVVQVSLSGADPAIYPQMEFPGLALCVTAISDQVQLVLEAVFAPADREPLEAAVLQKVYMIPVKTAEDLMILPN